MSMSSTHTLAFSSTTNTAASAPLLPSSFVTPAFHTFLARLHITLQSAFSQRRPWYELIDKTAFSRPFSITNATSRIRKNISYFRINYLTILSSILAFSLLSHPFSLCFLLSLLAAWLFLYLFRPSNHPVIIFGRVYSDRETLGGLITASVIVIFLTSVGSLIMTSMLMGVGVVCLHGAFRVPEDLFLDEQDSTGGTGMFSMLSGAASSAAVAAGANMV
ncbi:Prenylated rab acceptor PRA1 [Heracleum sosnowskyi]|uniref:PRA1 family protein n=1 Tax=Heracleum sosnowskyi TaxID=360622 RepID=A0AAD8LZV5_9APIA|nr:Prenylated rab acceptor PRA1 [Heracleum sosnowskyi]